MACKLPLNNLPERLHRRLGEFRIVDVQRQAFDAAVVVRPDRAFDRLEQAGQRHARAEEARARLAPLTSREMDVLEGLVRGHPNKTIAYDLGISPRTVEIHRANLMTKLEVASLSDALRIAFAAGLGDAESEAASGAA